MDKTYYYRSEHYWEFFDNASPHVREEKRWREEQNCANWDIKELERLMRETHPNRHRDFRPLEKKNGLPRA